MTTLLDPRLALDVARRAIGSEPSTTPEDRAAVGVSIRDACIRSEAAVRAFTGWHDARPAPEPEILNRSGWVAANLTSLAPIFERASEELRISSIARPVMRVATSVQIGLLFGYLSRKVIGQYDLFGSGRLYFVGPNVIEVERRADVDPDDFRLWVALHEITHALQDAGVPWLRGEITGFVDRSLTVMRSGPSPAKLVAALRDTVAGGRSMSSLLDAVLTPEQRALMRHAQGLMSIVEGHASFVMDRVGATMIDDVPALRRRVEGTRGSALAPERVMQSAIGLDAKRRQYLEGHAFFDAITASRGADAAEVVWESPDHVPSLDELADPGSWVKRIFDGSAV